MKHKKKDELSIEACLKQLSVIVLAGILVAITLIIGHIIIKGSIGFLSIFVYSLVAIAFIVKVFGYKYYNRTNYSKKQKVFNLEDFKKEYEGKYQQHHVEIDKELIEKSKEILTPTS